MKKLQPEFKIKFVEILRSGKYRQTDGFLKFRDNSGHVRYCAMGVAYKALDADYLKAKSDGTPVKKVTQSEFYEKTGFSGSVARKVINLNDNDSLSFRKIADWVEKNL